MGNYALFGLFFVTLVLTVWAAGVIFFIWTGTPTARKYQSTLSILSWVLTVILALLWPVTLFIYFLTKGKAEQTLGRQ